MKIDWPSSIADGDAVIVKDDTPDGRRFVVYSRREPQFMCPTYAEAEAKVLAYAAHAHAHAWYANGRGGLEILSDLPPGASFETSPASGRGGGVRSTRGLRT